MLDYCLAALTVIMITALVTFYLIRRKNLATRENTINLAICTVLAMVCATLTPLLANLMVKELYFSIILSVICSFVVAIALSFAAFLLSRRLLDNNKAIISKVDGRQSEVSLVNEIDVTGADQPEAEEISAFPEFFHIPELIDRAMECKRNHQFPEAITLYEKAVDLRPDADLLNWIIIDLCSLYKRTDQKALADGILRTESCNLVNIKVKESILQNL